VTRLRLGEFTTDVTFDMPGATWDYVNAMHAEYRFHEHWPAGMLCHITGEVDQGIRSIGIWRNRELEQHYFQNVAIEVITKSIQKLGPPPIDADGENFEPRSSRITGLLASSLCNAFADIGPDLDADAINALGTTPVIACFGSSADTPTVFGLDEIPEGLIIAWTISTPEGERELQVWASAEQAPATETHKLRRISFGSSELQA
jgi:hypothetical protein